MQWYDHIEKLNLQRLYSELYEIANRIWKDDSLLFLEYDIREDFHRGDGIAKNMRRDIDLLILKFKQVRQSILAVISQSKTAGIRNYNEVSTLEKMKKMAYYFAGIKESIKQIEMFIALDKETGEDNHRDKAIELLKTMIGYCGLSIKEMEKADRDLELGIKWSMKKRRQSSMNNRFRRIAEKIVGEIDPGVKNMTDIGNAVVEIKNRSRDLIQETLEKTPEDKVDSTQRRLDNRLMEIEKALAKAVQKAQGLYKKTPVNKPAVEDEPVDEEPVDEEPVEPEPTDEETTDEKKV